MSALRDIHEITTNFFKMLSSKHGSSIVIVHILSAHLVMAYKTALRAKEDFEKDKDKKIRDILVQLNGDERYWTKGGAAQIFQLAKYYSDSTSQDEFYKQLTEYRGYDISQQEAETWWWMLMLRGIVWEMSVWVNIQPPCVPARFYGHQMPVWIT